MQKEVLPKEVIFNLVPILYFIIPIVLGIVTGFVIKKEPVNNFVYSKFPLGNNE